MRSTAQQLGCIQSSKKFGKLYGAIWLSVLVVAGLLRFGSLSGQSLWLDEINTLEIARGSLWEVALASAKSNIQPPLYFLLVRGMTVVGNDEFTIRLPSAIAGFLTVPLIWTIAAQIASPFTALAAMIAFALSPFHIWYSQEARGYALVLFFLTASVSCLLAWSRGSKLARLGYLISTVLALYTHVLALPFLAVHLIMAYFLPKPSPASGAPADALTLYRFGQTLTASLLFLVPALFVLLRHSYVLYLIPPFSFVLEGPAEVSASMIAAGILYSVYAVVAGFSLGPSSRELHTVDGIWDLVPFVTTQVVIFWIVIGIILVLGIRTAWRERLTQVTVLGWPAILMVLIPGAAFFAEAVLYPRFLIAATPPICLLVGLGTNSLATRSRRLLALIAFAGVTFIPLWNGWSDPRYAKEDIRAAAQYLADVAGEQDIIIVSTGNMVSVLRFYCGESTRCRAKLVPYPADHAWADAERIARDMPKLLHGKTRVWLLHSRPFHSDPQGLVISYFVAHHEIELRAEWAGVMVYEVKRKAQPLPA